MLIEHGIVISITVKNHVKSVSQIFSARNKNKFWDLTVGIKTKLCIVFIVLI